MHLTTRHCGCAIRPHPNNIVVGKGCKADTGNSSKLMLRWLVIRHFVLAFVEMRDDDPIPVRFLVAAGSLLPFQRPLSINRRFARPSPI